MCKLLLIDLVCILHICARGACNYDVKIDLADLLGTKNILLLFPFLFVLFICVPGLYSYKAQLFVVRLCSYTPFLPQYTDDGDQFVFG